MSLRKEESEHGGPAWTPPARQGSGHWTEELGPGPFLAFAAVVLALAVAAVPIANADLHWYLTLGKWAARYGLYPTNDPLSWTRPGAEYADYYRAVETLYWALYAKGGFHALWLLKGVLVLTAGALSLRVAQSKGLGPQGRHVAALALAGGLLPNADLRPENFSLVFFAAQLLLLEALSARPPRPAACALAGTALYSAWATFHPGFPTGLLVLGGEALGLALASGARSEGRPPGRATALAAFTLGALAGTLINPLGPEVWGAVFYHGRTIGRLGKYVSEWSLASPSVPSLWPFYAVLAAFLAAAALGAWSQRRERLGRLLAAAILGGASVRYLRFSGFFILLAVPLVAEAASRSAWFKEKGWKALGRGWLPAAAALAFVFFYLRTTVDYGKVWASSQFPVAAADFLEAQPPLRGLRLYHPEYWGGYLGFRLWPATKIFTDGRPLFHDVIEEATAVRGDPTRVREYMDKRGVELAVLRHRESYFKPQAGPADGPPRPMFVEAFPSATWALVFWDGQAFIFARRDRVPKDWLARNEYKHLRPYDWPAIERAVAEKSMPCPELDAELTRHAAQSPDPAAHESLRKWVATLCPSAP